MLRWPAMVFLQWRPCGHSFVAYAWKCKLRILRDNRKCASVKVCNLLCTAAKTRSLLVVRDGYFRFSNASKSIRSTTSWVRNELKLCKEYFVSSRNSAFVENVCLFHLLALYRVAFSTCIVYFLGYSYFTDCIQLLNSFSCRNSAQSYLCRRIQRAMKTARNGAALVVWKIGLIQQLYKLKSIAGWLFCLRNFVSFCRSFRSKLNGHA